MAEEPTTYDTVDLSDLLARRGRTVDVNLGGGDRLIVTWQPDKLEPAVYAQISEALKPGEGLDPEKAARVLIVPVAASWSITDAGAPLPLTVENVLRTGPIITRLIGNALLVDMAKVMTPEEIADTKEPSVA